MKKRIRMFLAILTVSCVMTGCAGSGENVDVTSENTTEVVADKDETTEELTTEEEVKTFAEENGFQYLKPGDVMTGDMYVYPSDEQGNPKEQPTVKSCSGVSTITIDSVTVDDADVEGYKDITIKSHIDITVEVVTDMSARWYVWYQYVAPVYSDAYTGRYIPRYEAEYTEGTEDVTYKPTVTTINWRGRDYTITNSYAEPEAEDTKTGFRAVGMQDDGMHYKNEAAIYIANTLRVPCDYDGLTIVCLKDYTKEHADLHIANKDKEFTYDSDTTVLDPEIFSGYRITPDDLYFYRVEDFLSEKSAD